MSLQFNIPTLNAPATPPNAMERLKAILNVQDQYKTGASTDANTAETLQRTQLEAQKAKDAAAQKAEDEQYQKEVAAEFEKHPNDVEGAVQAILTHPNTVKSQTHTDAWTGVLQKEQLRKQQADAAKQDLLTKKTVFQQQQDEIKARNDYWGAQLAAGVPDLPENRRQAMADYEAIGKPRVLKDAPATNNIYDDMGKVVVPAIAKPDKPTNAFELWAQQNPNAKVSDWLAMQPKPQAPADAVVNYSEDGENRLGLLGRGASQLRPLQTPGGTTAGAKLSEPPAAVKTQGSAALTALKQVDNIRAIIGQNPQLIGPIAGRFQEFMQGVGANPFVGTKDERLGAQLAEHLNALFAQELRSMFPGRTNSQMQDIIKSTSARMKQDPNLMLGFLEGIEKNEGMVLETAKQQGFVADRGAPSAQSKPPTMILNGKTLTLGPDGKYH